MKKIIVTVCLCAVFGALIGGCASGKAPASESVQIPNPITDCKTMEEAENLTGFDMTAPESMEGFAEKSISVISDNLIQVRFIQAEQELIVRKARGTADCSGDYTQYAQSETVTVKDIPVCMKGDKERVCLAVWTDGEYAFSIGFYGSEGLSTEEMASLVQQVL